MRLFDTGESEVELFDCELMTLNYLKKEDRRKNDKKSVNWANFDSVAVFQP